MTGNTFPRGVLSMAVSAALFGAAFNVSAQQDTQQAEANDTLELERIEVTARRVTENLQEVPVAVTSLGETDLLERGINTVNEVQQFSPNTTLQVSRGTNSTLTAYIRGIGQQDPLWGYEPGVGIYVDDVYIARPQGAVLDVYDVERIEVLRGPQGTLYGKNTIGGAVKYVTKRLTDEPSLTVEGALGSYNQREGKIAGSIPVTDNFYVGAAAAILKRDGFGDNIVDGWDNYNKDVLTGRISMEYMPSDSVFIRYQYDTTDDESNSKGGHRLTPSIVTGEPVLDDVFDTRAGMAPDNDVETSGHALTLEWAINDSWTFKSITSDREGDTLTNIDFDNTQVNSLDVPAIYDDEQFTQEFQFNYASDRFNASMGAYYYDGEACGVFGVVLGLAGITLENGGCVDTESKAIYAQGTYDIDDNWSVVFGGRYTEDEKTADIYRYIYVGEKYPNDNPDDFIFAGAQTDIEGATEDWDHFSPRIGVNYTFNDDVMMYASFSNGFKSGGFDMRANMGANPEADAPFDPETVDSYEMGVKSELFDRRLRLNAAVFYNEYDDMQVTAQRAVNNGNDFVSAVLNAGESEAKGAELEMEALITDNFTMNAAIGYIDAEFTEFASFDPETGEPVNLADQWVISNTPDWTANIGFNYNYELASGDVIINGNWYYRGDAHVFEQPSAIDNGSYDIANLSATYYPANGDWWVGLHGKNIFDEEYRVAGYNFPATFDDDGNVVTPGLGGEDTVVGYYGDPATVTLTFGYAF